jgi:hypothetical protein
VDGLEQLLGKTNSGTAARTKLEATSLTFCTNWKMTASPNTIRPKISATPIIEKATGKPRKRAISRAGNINSDT